jgi:regulator of cell morphogenesis and NO signaling
MEDLRMTTAVLDITQRRLGDIIIDDERAAAVLERHGLDFCCGGRRTLDEACRARAISAEAVASDLAALGQPGTTDKMPDEWQQLDVLARFIRKTHHEYVKSSMPIILQWLDRLVDRHGPHHPELAKVRMEFRGLVDELTGHLQKEEMILFPYIESMVRAKKTGGHLPPGCFSSVLGPVRVMEDEHEHAGQSLVRLRALTGDYTAPEDGCTTYRSCYSEMLRFDRDLRRHIHLENNILFPRALEMERTFA